MAEMLQNVYVIEKPVPTPVQNSNSPMNDEQALEANYIQRLLNNQNNKVPEAEHADAATEADTAKATEKSNTAEQSNTAHVAEELSDAGKRDLLKSLKMQMAEEEEFKEWKKIIPCIFLAIQTPVRHICAKSWQPESVILIMRKSKIPNVKVVTSL